MDRRGVTATLCATLAGGGIAAMIGATALPDGSPYFTVLMVIGVAAIVIGMGGLLFMLVTASPSAQSAPSELTLDRSQIPAGLDDKEKSIWYLRRARERAVIARKRWFGFEGHHQAFSELKAAILGVKKELGVAGLLTIAKNSDEPTYRDLLRIYVTYVDGFLPLLESGQIETARKAASRFRWSQGPA